MDVAVIVQARMGSTRLPGKVLQPVNDRPLLAYLLERLRRVKRAQHLLIATTDGDGDLPIVDFCTQHQVQVYRGSEHDVLARYFEAAKEVAADTIVRVTADCPVIDPEIIDAAIERFQSGNDTHYLSNTQVRSYPRGMDVEVFSFDALREAQQLATKQEEREHVTPFIYKHPERYHMQDLVQSEDESYWRWTVDTPDDYLLIQEMIQDLYPQHPRFAIADMRAFMKKHPNLAEINSHVEQKKLSC